MRAFINAGLVLDFLSSISVLKCVERVFKSLGTWTNVGNHDGFAVATNGILEQSGQLAVSVRDVLGTIGQSVDAISQRQ